MSSTITIYTRVEIEEIVKEKLKLELSFIYQELDKFRNRLSDIDTLLAKSKERQLVSR